MTYWADEISHRGSHHGSWLMVNHACLFYEQSLEERIYDHRAWFRCRGGGCFAGNSLMLQRDFAAALLGIKKAALSPHILLVY